MTSYLEITHFIKTFLQSSAGLFTNGEPKIPEVQIFSQREIRIKASDKKKAKNILFLHNDIRKL